MYDVSTSIKQSGDSYGQAVILYRIEIEFCCVDALTSHTDECRSEFSTMRLKTR